MRSGALVAGGTGALGRAVVRELLDAGSHVTVTWVDAEERDELERDLGGETSLSLVEADLTDPAAAASAVEAAGDSLGAVACLVGGYAGGAKVGEADAALLDRMVTLNVKPVYLLARAAMPVLVEAGGGTFLGVSARPALRPAGGAAAYAAAKAGVLSLIRSLDAEYRDAGVRSNAIVPSVIDTPRNRMEMPGADHSKWATPGEVARVVRFLLSEESAPTSGAAVPVYGLA